ncbi:MAG TPA: hypothetical protein VHP83_22835 [Aggregatilineaceae bacterium]|nr:hypothetical protein [Aggregatilineaceae bacterium]
MARRREQTSGWRDWSMVRRARGVNRTNLMIGVALIILLVVLVVPRVYPAARQGITCTDLASPLGGNNRSVLALAGDDEQHLALEVRLEKDPLTLNEQLVAYVTFVNNDVGPIILHFNTSLPPIIVRSDNLVNGALAIPVNSTQPGIAFEFRRENAAWDSPDMTLVPSPNTTLNYEDLHLLGSRSRCTMKYVIDPATITNALPAGTYRIRAFYRNVNQGVLPAPAAGAPTATATAAYTDQGVWTGLTKSEEVLFTVGSSTASP